MPPVGGENRQREADLTTDLNIIFNANYSKANFTRIPRTS